MKQAGENSNSLKMVFRNRPENEKIVRTTAAVFASVLDPTLEEISDFKTDFSSYAYRLYKCQRERKELEAKV